MAKNDNLGDFLKSTADKLRSKLGTTDAINPQDFEYKIDEISSGGVVMNIENGSGSSALQQIFDVSNTLDFTG